MQMGKKKSYVWDGFGLTLMSYYKVFIEICAFFVCITLWSDL